MVRLTCRSSCIAYKYPGSQPYPGWGPNGSMVQWFLVLKIVALAPMSISQASFKPLPWLKNSFTANKNNVLGAKDHLAIYFLMCAGDYITVLKTSFSSFLDSRCDRKTLQWWSRGEYRKSFGSKERRGWGLIQFRKSYKLGVTLMKLTT